MESVKTGREEGERREVVKGKSKKGKKRVWGKESILTV